MSYFHWSRNTSGSWSFSENYRFRITTILFLTLLPKKDKGAKNNGFHYYLLLSSFHSQLASSVFRRAKKEQEGWWCGKWELGTALPWRPPFVALLWVRANILIHDSQSSKPRMYFHVKYNSLDNLVGSTFPVQYVLI